MVALTNRFFFSDIVGSLKDKGWEVYENGIVNSIRPKHFDEKNAVKFLEETGIYVDVALYLNFRITPNYVVFSYNHDKNFSIDDLIRTHSEFNKIMREKFPAINEKMNFKNLKYSEGIYDFK